MTDRVFIENLEVETIIGVLDWERRVRQRICIDLEMAADIGKAASTDALEDALDYHAVSKRLTEFIEQSRFQLLESLAEALAELLQKEFGVQRLKLKLSKPGAIANAGNVGVMIERAVKRAV